MEKESTFLKRLLEVQKKIEPADKSGKTPQYTYATIGNLIGACKKLLNANNILVTQAHYTNEHGSFVETRLRDVCSDEFIGSCTKVVCGKPNDPQAFGAASTYARKFGLQSILFMHAEDDDAKSAMPPQRQNNYQPKNNPRQNSQWD